MKKFLLNSTGNEITAPIDASYFKGCGLRQGIEREFVLLMGDLMKAWPTITGALCANSHPGSYTGQDAFNNMLPIIERDSICITGQDKVTRNSSEGGRQVT